MTRVCLAFLRRDFLVHASYRLEVLLELLRIIFSAGIFYYISRLMTGHPPASLADYGGDYFPFILIGLAFSSYQTIGLKALSDAVRQEQTLGTLEPILSTPIGLFSFLIAPVQGAFLGVTLETVFYLLAGTILFHLDLSKANLLAASAALALSLGAFLGLGMISASILLKFKRGDPLSWLLATVSELLGGVYFPIQLLPAWLRRFSPLLPLTPSMEGLRRALLQGASLRQIAPQLFSLLLFSILLIPLGVFCFNWALDSVKKDGSLGHY